MTPRDKELIRQMHITTIYHSLFLQREEFFGKSPLRTNANVRKISDLIENIHNRYHLIHASEKQREISRKWQENAKLFDRPWIIVYNVNKRR